ncbi:hypothetical protein [Sphaerotilus sp.]|uniref:hypothetical protein n=1 Tax=Sphaerotilus sp. TaxID=2093942 RepID=UPI002ACDC114|nr:hypothetical protein [Sphaerotilus sp.]MDZ7858764.1 hypothetical protein [Sphaerotilus sp.]
MINLHMAGLSDTNGTSRGMVHGFRRHAVRGVISDGRYFLLDLRRSSARAGCRNSAIHTEVVWMCHQDAPQIVFEKVCCV